MTSRYILTIEAVSHVSWTLGTAAGALAGTVLAALIGGNITLLGFVLTSLFVVLAIENWRSHPDPAVLVIGVLAGAVGMTVGGSAALLSALGVLSAGLVALYCRRRCSTSGPAARRAVSGAPGTDHTREYVPLLVYGARIRPNTNLGTYPTFAMIGATVADMFDAALTTKGESLLPRILAR